MVNGVASLRKYLQFSLHSLNIIVETAALLQSLAKLGRLSAPSHALSVKENSVLVPEGFSSPSRD